MKVAIGTVAPLTADSVCIFGRPALADIVAERVEQIDVHGFTLEHDAGHHPGELAGAALSYLATGADQLHGKAYPPTEHPDTWPWEREAWRPGTARENLIKGIAIAWAAVDRIDGLDAGKPDATA